MHTGLDCAGAERARLPSVAPRRAAVAGCVGACDCSPVVDCGGAAQPSSSVGVLRYLANLRVDCILNRSSEKE